MIYLALFWEFFKIGLFSIGGGLATLPFLYKLAETHPHWLNTAQIGDMVAISESTPGPIGINMATYAGFQAAGPLGGIIATLGEITPSVIIIIIIARFLTNFDKNRRVQDAFYALRPAVVGLIAFAGIKLLSIVLYEGEVFHTTSALLFALLVVLVLSLKKVHPLIWIIGGAIFGIVFKVGG
ncbi:MAG: chromate transporter [Sphaerochaeta sp.]|jgi:chromate transporter|nr:chromate transporter [Spirochaetales bacterium]